MTLAAPKSRQGKFMLVLTVLAVLVAVAGTMVWANNARADLPQTFTELNQAPDGGGSVTQGDTVTYVGSVTLTAPLLVATDVLVVEMLVDPDLLVASGTSSADVVCSAGALSFGFNVSQWCTFPAPVLVGTYTITVTGIATGGPISAPTIARACSEAAGGNWYCNTEAGNDLIQLDDDNPVDVGPLTVNPAVTVTNATNFPGLGHTFIFNLAAGVTCQSDVTVNGNVDCASGPPDVTTAGAAGCTAGAPIVSASSLGTPTTVSVTIDGGLGIAGTCTVSLDTKFVGPAEGAANGADADDFDIAIVTATKTFAVSGELRHRDAADPASEDAATGAAPAIPNNTDPYCNNPGWGQNPCGLLSAQHDGDDATGSYHEACIIGSTLTQSANAGIITWNITTVAGSPTVYPTPPTKFAGPNDEPCVRWGSNNAGSQQITATVDADAGGPNPAIILYWDNDTQAPLIKEWNDLDPTLLIGVTGDVGDTLGANTLELDQWANRDCTTASGGFCARANLDGTTIAELGVVIGGPVQKGFIDAAGVSFIDYAMGSHQSGPSDAYDGPVDGALQTYTISGLCGSVRLENPMTGEVIILSNNSGSGTYVSGTPNNPYSAATILSSDKGVGFQVVPNSNGAIETIPTYADCLPGAEVWLTIATSEANDFGSPPLDTVPNETIHVRFDGGQLGSKHPDLAWAGQRKSLDADWRVEAVVGGKTVLQCPYGSNEEFYVRYVQHAGSPGALMDDLGDGVAEGNDFMTVKVQVAEAFDAVTGHLLPNTGCRSSVLYETEGEGQVDVFAVVVDSPTGGSVLSDEQDFLIFYMKFYDITMDPTTAQDVNVSLGTDVTATVRGWTVTNSSNCAQLSAFGDPAADGLPAGMCVFPDDWVYLATGQRGETSVPVATVDRPEWDLWGGSTVPCTNTTSAGPLSMLDRDGCGTGSAPHVTLANRDAIFADGLITPDDAPMPVSLVKFELVNDTNGVVCATNPTTATEGCSGFIKTADSTAAQYDQTHIPAESWIPPTTAGFPPQGYSWNTWGPAGQPNTGLYNFWEAAQSGDEVISCAGANPCTDGVPTDGYKWVGVYSDNHGVAKATVFGDADLTFTDCDTAASATNPALGIVLVNGLYCEPNDEVGTASVVARADYPDKRKHPQMRSGELDFTFTWAGIKEVSVVSTVSDQFNYVVFHVTDRDGYCGTPPATSGHVSLHPVLGEAVNFHIESPDGEIADNENGDPAAKLGTVSADFKTADVFTFQASDTAVSPAYNASIADGGHSVLPLIQTDPDECQAWIHISESLGNEVNVRIRAEDPEGIVTFDVIVNPFVEPPATPAPTPFTLSLIWGDTDCSGKVLPRDGQALLRYLAAQTALTQSPPCLVINEAMTVVGKDGTRWGDWDCNGTVLPRDGQGLLRHMAAQTLLTQTGDCPAIGDSVQVQPVAP